MINTYDPATMNTQAIRELTGEVTKLKIETNVLSEQIEDVEAEIPELPTPAVADAGKVLSVSESGEYELSEGGGGTGGNSAILTVNADKYGLICSNPNADIINLEQIYETNITVYYSIYSGGKTVFRNQDVNETLSLSDLYYLDNGSEVSYSGIKNFVTLETLVTITGSSLAALDSALLVPSSHEYYLILDLDTGHVIYAHEDD